LEEHGEGIHAALQRDGNIRELRGYAAERRGIGLGRHAGRLGLACIPVHGLFSRLSTDSQILDGYTGAFRLDANAASCDLGTLSCLGQLIEIVRSRDCLT